MTLSTSLLVYFGLGVGLSYAVHDLWPSVPQGPPVWLPTAWVRADLGLPYLAFLVVLPMVAVIVPAWLFYEVTIANLAGPSDDRSTRLRLWTIISTLALAGCAALVQVTTREVEWAMAEASLLFGFFVFVIFMIAGEPLGPSRRVRIVWERQKRGRALRAIGPGVVSATTWVLALLLLAFAILLGVGLVSLTPGSERDALVLFDGQLLAYAVFLCGLSAFFRARAEGATAPRVLLLVTILTTTIGPWIAMAIAGVATRGGDDALALAAPSPTYAFVLAQQIQRSATYPFELVLPAILCSAGYALFGVGLLALAASRTHQRLAAERARLTQLETLLDAELQAEQGSVDDASQAPVEDPTGPAPT